MAFLDNAGLAHFKEKILGIIRTPFKAATASAAGEVGAVPAPGAGAQGMFLNGAGQWVSVPQPSVMKGASASAAGASGLVPAPAKGAQGMFLNGAGQWQAINLSGAVPPGVMAPFAGRTVPSGWLLCNGASVASATYPALYAAIGTTWGGNSTNFYLPNFNGRHILGTTSPSSVGGTVGAGLPDITGNAISGVMWQANQGGSGALTTSPVSGGLAYNGGTDNVIRMYFDASSFDSTYGRTYGVSVPAAYTLIIIKV